MMRGYCSKYELIFVLISQRSFSLYVVITDDWIILDNS